MTPAARPLSGVRVLDFSSALAGPWTAGILADQGADVIKVEQPPSGDVLRMTQPAHNGVSAMFHAANRGKRSIVLDLRDPDGRETALRLAETADLVVQNFRPGVAERLGVGYDDLRRRREDTILLSVTGFGPTGPYAHRPAYDSVIQAMSGMAALEGGDEPRLASHTIADKITSLVAAQAAVAALFARDRGMGGQRIDVPMLDVAVSFLWVDAAGESAFPEAPAGAARVATAGRQCIRLADGWVAITLGTAAARRALCDALGLDPDDFPGATAPGRPAGPDDREQLLTAARGVARHLSRADAAAVLERAGVPFALVERLADLPDDAHAVASGLFVESDHPEAGIIRQCRPPVRFAGVTPATAPASPALGEHSAEILAELARVPPT